MKRKMSALFALLMVMMMISAGVVYLAEPAVAGGDCTPDTAITLGSGDQDVDGVTFTLTWAGTGPDYTGFSWTNPSPTGAEIRFRVDRSSSSDGYTTPTYGADSYSAGGTRHIDAVWACGQYPEGGITIRKSAPGAGNTNFAFTGDLGTFSLKNGHHERFDRGAGTYVVNEPVDTMPAGWALGSVSCSLDGGEGPLGYTTPSSGTVSVALAAGQQVECTFVNERSAGRIIITKDTNPESQGSYQEFQFHPSWGAAFTLADDGSYDSEWTLAPQGGDGPADGYSVYEDLPAGWSQASVACTDGEDPMDIDLSAGETVTCDFVNETAMARIIIDKVTVPGGSVEPFSFELRDPGGTLLAAPSATDGGSYDSGWTIPPFDGEGGYTVDEILSTSQLAAGWSLASEYCDRSEDPGNIDLIAGETVTCTFTNKVTTLRVEKVVENNDGGLLSCSDFSFSVNGGAAIPFEADCVNELPVQPGTYTVTESAVPAGYTASIPTSGTYDCTSRNISAGETRTCRITNRDNQGWYWLRVVKDAPDGVACDNFQFQVDGGPAITFEADCENVLASASRPTTVTEVQDLGYEFPPQYDNCQPVSFLRPRCHGWGATCTITNTALQMGTIEVVKETLPDDPAGFGFTGIPTSADADGILHDADGVVSWPVTAGQHLVAEVLPLDGWDLTGISCSDADSSGDPATGIATFNVEAGETVRCTFTNTKRGQILIDKNTIPTAGTNLFEFEASWDGEYGGTSDFSLDDDDAPYASPLLVPGNYSVAESAESGWDLTDLVCVDPDRGSSESLAEATATIDLDAGETVICTFTNTQRGRFIVDKVITPQGTPDQQFEFDLPWGESNLFLGGVGTLESPMLVPGDYYLGEVTPLPDGWEFVSRRCMVTLGDGVGQEVEPGVDGKIHLGPGQEITCTFTNFKLPEGSLLIVKDATPGDDTVFGFACGWDDCVGPGVGSFSLSDPGNAFRLFENLETGDYTVTEGALPDGWQFDGVSCVSGGESIAAAVDGRSMTVPVSRNGPGVACTFRNSGYGRIIVEKVTGPADAPAQSFEFAPSWGANFSLSNGGSADSGLLAAGVYSVAEVLPLPAGWEFASAVCSDTSSVNAIAVSVNETVTCTFTNLYDPASLIIRKEADPLADPDTTVFRFVGDLGSFELLDGGSKAFSVASGVELSITEIVSGGWDLADVRCTGAVSLTPPAEDGDTAVVVVAANGHGECTFHNVEMGTLGPTGSLTIIKETDPDGGERFEFTTSENLSGPFTLDDDGSKVFSQLAAGAYTVTEATAEDWEFVSVDCDALEWSDDGQSVTVNLAEGEAAVCTFTNRGEDTEGPGELPYTGPQPFMMPLLIAGLWALLMGLGLSVWSRMQGADRA